MLLAVDFPPFKTLKQGLFHHRRRIVKNIKLSMNQSFLEVFCSYFKTGFSRYIRNPRET